MMGSQAKLSKVPYLQLYTEKSFSFSSFCAIAFLDLRYGRAARGVLKLWAVLEGREAPRLQAVRAHSVQFVTSVLVLAAG